MQNPYTGNAPQYTYRPPEYAPEPTIIDNYYFTQQSNDLYQELRNLQNGVPASEYQRSEYQRSVDALQEDYDRRQNEYNNFRNSSAYQYSEAEVVDAAYYQQAKRATLAALAGVLGRLKNHPH